MIETELKTIESPNGEIQRVFSARLDDWDSLQFYEPAPAKESFERICNLYEKYIIPKAPYVFGTLVFFSLPDDLEIPFDFYGKYGLVGSRLTAAAIGLKLFVKNGKVCFEHDPACSEFVDELKSRGLFRIVEGKRPNHVSIMPVSSKIGFLSSGKTSSLKVNSNFFVMDVFDVDSPYDTIGTPIGMRVKNGEMFSPPLFGRECLIVRDDGSVSIEIPRLNDFSFTICGKEFVPEKNCRLFERPEKRKTSVVSGVDVIVIGNKVAAINTSDKTPIPSSGFVLRICKEDSLGIKPGDAVIFNGAENVRFALQVGNSAIISGVKTPGFISPFSNVKNLLSVNTPPSLYPHDYEKDRAPRIVLGADKEGRPVLLWIEGPGKNGYTKGVDSCGASLSEVAEICSKAGLENAINLDGGGSAQILIDGKRALMISDRNPDGTEAERAVPVGLYVK